LGIDKEAESFFYKVTQNGYPLYRRRGRFYNDRRGGKAANSGAVPGKKYAGKPAQRRVRIDPVHTEQYCHSGRNNSATISTIKKICDGLNITIQEFFGADCFCDLEQEIK